MNNLLERIMILRSVELFSGADEILLQRLARSLKPVSFEGGEEVFAQGDFGTSMFVIVSGSVSIEQNGVCLGDFSEREVFGELAALDPEPRSATVKTREATTLYELSQSVLMELIINYPEIGFATAQVLTKRLREATERNSRKISE